MGGLFACLSASNQSPSALRISCNRLYCVKRACSLNSKPSIVRLIRASAYLRCSCKSAIRDSICTMAASSNMARLTLYRKLPSPNQQQCQARAYHVLMMAVGFTQQPLNPVTRHRTTQFLARCKTNLSFQTIRLKSIQHKIPVRPRTAGPVNPLEITSALQHPFSR